MKKTTIIIGFLLSVSTLLLAQTADIVYIKPDASSTAWAGRQNVYVGFSEIRRFSGEVWVAEGHYSIPTSARICYIDAQKLLGGFAGTETNPNQRKLKNAFEYEHTTTISCGESLGNLALERCSEFDGFKFVSERSYITTLTIYTPPDNRRSTFSHLSSNDANLWLHIFAENAVIHNCQFIGNLSDSDYPVLEATNTIVANSVFSNHKYMRGTPIKLVGTDTIGVLSGNAKSMLVNCYFQGNEGRKGAVDATNTVVSSCSFVRNKSRKSGGGLYVNNIGLVENSIFYRNFSGYEIDAGKGVYADNCYARNRNIKYIASDDYLYYDDTDIVLVPSDPVYTANTELYSDAEKLIDQGEIKCKFQVPDTLHNFAATDVNGKNRITGSKIDVGAVEFQQKRIEVSQQVIVPDFVEDQTLVLRDENIQLTSSKDWVWWRNGNNVNFSVTTSPQFRFKHWYIKEYDQIMFTDPNWNYTLESGYQYDSLNVVAVLDIDHYGVKIVPNLPSSGTFTASQPRIYWGQELTLAADVKPGYQFKDWRFNGVSVGNTATNTFLAKPNLLFGGTDTLIYEAVLARDTCNVSVRMEPEFAGNITKPEVFLYDSLVTLTATSAPHFRILKWTVDGDSVANGETYQFLPQGSAEIVVYADSIYYQIDGEISDPAIADKVELRGVNRSYSSGSQVAIEAVLPVGVQFNHWNAYKNGSASPLRWAENPHTFSADANYRIVADIQRNAYEVTVGALPELSAEVVADKNEYFYGDTATITATIADGYMLDDWRICTSGWTGYSCAESYSWAASTQVGQTAVLKLPITDNVVVYANQKVGIFTANTNLEDKKEIAILQISENQVLVSLSSAEKSWQLQVFNLCGQHLQTLQITDKETILTLPSKNFYLLKFTQNEKMVVEKVIVN